MLLRRFNTATTAHQALLSSSTTFHFPCFASCCGQSVTCCSPSNCSSTHTSVSCTAARHCSNRKLHLKNRHNKRLKTMSDNASDAAPAAVPAELPQKQTLGERMKTYETETHIDPNNSFLVRLDGKTFSSFTGKFRKPFDPRFTRAMVKTTHGLLKFFNSASAFVCSDEITLVHSPVYGNMQEHPHNGRKNKIATLAAGKCSTLFLLAILDECKDDPDLCDFITNKAPCFDARVMEIPMPDAAVDVAKNIYWRSVFDCRKNTTSSYARFLLTTKGSQNKHSGLMVDAMKVCGVASDENAKYLEKSVAALKQIDCATVKASLPADSAPIEYLEEERNCLLFSEDGDAATKNVPIGFDFSKMPLYKVFGVYVKRVATRHINEDGEEYRRHRPASFEMEMTTKMFDAAAKFLLLPKLEEEDLKAFEEEIGVKPLLRL